MGETFSEEGKKGDRWSSRMRMTSFYELNRNKMREKRQDALLVYSNGWI